MAKTTGKSLVIVESPAKAKTINKYLGSNFEVKASMGHIRDLPAKGINVDIENNFEPGEERKHDGIGLVNVKKQLDLLYPGRYNLVIRDIQGVYRADLTLEVA